MGTIVPEHLPLATLTNQAEREAVEVLCDRWPDDCLLFPNQRLAGYRN